MPQLSFDYILMRYPNFIKIDLLSIDVEGHEKEVLEGLKTTNLILKLLYLRLTNVIYHQLAI